MDIFSFIKPFLITLREGFEAALIIGILYTYIAKKQENSAENDGSLRMIWAGVGVAAVLSVIFGVVLAVVQASIPEEYGELMEGMLMFLSAILLFYMIFWLNHSALSRELKTAVDTAATPVMGVFLVSFTSVLREGVETTLFLHSAQDKTILSWLGVVVGLAAAAGIGYLIFARGSKMPMKQLFSWTSILLVIFAAWMIFVGCKATGKFFFEDEIPMWLNVVRSILGVVVLGFGYNLWRKQQQ